VELSKLYHPVLKRHFHFFYGFAKTPSVEVIK